MERWCSILFINNSLWACYLTWVYDEDDDGYFSEAVSTGDPLLFNSDKWWIKSGGADSHCAHISTTARDCPVF